VTVHPAGTLPIASVSKLTFSAMALVPTSSNVVITTIVLIIELSPLEEDNGSAIAALG